MMTPAWWGVVAAIGWGGSDLIGRITARELGAVGAMWGLSVTGALLAGLLYIFFPHQFPHHIQDWLWLAGTSAVALLAPILFYQGLTLGPMALVAPIAAAYPVWVVAVALLQGFHPGALAWVAMALVALGTIIVGRTAPADPDETLGADPANRKRAIWFAGLTSVGFAITLIAGAHTAALVGSITTLAATRLTGVFMIGVARPWRGRPGFRRPSMLGLLLLQGLLDNTAFIAIYLGSQHGGAGVTAVGSSGFMVVAVLLAALVLKERPGRRCLAGAAAVFAGIAFLAAHGP
jgi:drug/metabolite transporter (DMT)-like permease